MNICEYCYEKVARGASYSIDFKTRTLTVDHRDIIIDGAYEGELGVQAADIDEVMDNIEVLYQHYKHSIPSEKTDSRRRNYFCALREAELDDEDMMYGVRRMEAMFTLEFYFLAFLINGSLYWKDDWGWFWQSEKDKDLVILRSWVVGG